jgi:MFS superfamily sulfate permease-like transporter/CRP-like cAMP-binding protein
MAVKPVQIPAQRVPSWPEELGAGVAAGLLAIPLCLAPAVLIYTPLGQEYAAAGAAAGLIGAVVGGAVAALIATSSFVITVPRASNALVLSTVVATLMTRPGFIGNPQLILATTALLVFLAGIWQVAFGIFRIARVIKFTPHPVFAGFCNGVALLIIKSQLLPFFRSESGTLTALPHHLTTLVFALVLVAIAVNYLRLATWLSMPRWLSRMPGIVVVFVLGTAVYFVTGALLPGIDLGADLGEVDFLFDSPLIHLGDSGNTATLLGAGWNLLLVSFVLALVASMESLMSLRSAQQLVEINFHPVRELAAQGVANAVTSFFAPVAGSISPALLTIAYRNGGRTRITALIAAAVVLAVGIGCSGALAQVPTVVLSAVLIATGVTMIDGWSIRLAASFIGGTSPQTRRRDALDLVVVAAVMGITAITTVVVGVLAGILLSAVVFVINMSRPVVRRRFSGDEIFSRRARSADDIIILKRTASRRAVLQLEGVLFFGNAEDLAREVKEVDQNVDMIVLDMRAVTDIDVSGATIIGNLMRHGRERGKKLLFCNVLEDHLPIVRRLFERDEAAEAALKPDLESALEWIEDETLRSCGDERSLSTLLPLEEIDFVDGLSDHELVELRGALKLREFESGEAICREGDPGDRMWLLAKGSVSVRLQVGDARSTRRITSLGRGTLFGEMALIEGAVRSASIVADEPVACYELDSNDFDQLLEKKPVIAAKIMRNVARELTRRLRRTSEDLRHAAS